MACAPLVQPCAKCGADTQAGIAVECIGGELVDAPFCPTCQPDVFAALDRVEALFHAYRADGLSAETATKAILRWHMRT